MFRQAEHLVQERGGFFSISKRERKMPFPRLSGCSRGCWCHAQGKGQPLQPLPPEEPEHRGWALPVTGAHPTSWRRLRAAVNASAAREEASAGTAVKRERLVSVGSWVWGAERQGVLTAAFI